MPTPRKANPQKGGRPTAYREEFVQQAEHLIALGATDCAEPSPGAEEQGTPQLAQTANREAPNGRFPY